MLSPWPFSKAVFLGRRPIRCSIRHSYRNRLVDMALPDGTLSDKVSPKPSSEFVLPLAEIPSAVSIYANSSTTGQPHRARCPAGLSCIRVVSSPIFRPWHSNQSIVLAGSCAKLRAASDLCFLLMIGRTLVQVSRQDPELGC